MTTGKRSKVAIISLRDTFLDSDRVMPPIGVMSLHAYMLECGIDSEIENNFNISELDTYGSFSHFAISCMTPEKDEALAILNAVKKRFPDKKVIIGGPHASYYFEECKKEPFDYIVRGDGEFALRDIMMGRAEGVRELNMPLSETEMNQLPIPYREKSFLNQYNFYIQDIRATTILTAKGCPMNCAFCEDAGTKVKLYEPGYISRQIAESKDAGYQAIMFFDDIFTLSKKRVAELTTMISKHDIYYRCFGHANTISDEMAQMLSDSGCIETGFGAESGSQKILDVINKKTTVEKNRRYVEICNRHGIKVKAFIMLGLPGESLDTIKETRDFIEFLVSNTITTKTSKQVSNDFDLTIYFPYKGTHIRDAIDSGIQTYDLLFTCDPDLAQGFYKGRLGSTEGTVCTRALSGKDIIKIQKELFAEFKSKVLV